MGFTGGYYTGGGNSAGTVMAILLLLAVVLTVLAFIFIVPENRREKLSAFGKFLHDTCNFNYLLIEKILQALYIFLTVFAILMGLYTVQRENVRNRFAIVAYRCHSKKHISGVLSPRYASQTIIVNLSFQSILGLE